MLTEQALLLFKERLFLLVLLVQIYACFFTVRSGNNSSKLATFVTGYRRQVEALLSALFLCHKPVALTGAIEALSAPVKQYTELRWLACCVRRDRRLVIELRFGACTCCHFRALLLQNFAAKRTASILTCHLLTSTLKRKANFVLLLRAIDKW